MSLLDDVSIVVTPNGYKAGELYAVVPVPSEGAELVTNGDFATDTKWTTNTGWDISGGSANCDGSQTSNSTLVQQNGILGVTLDLIVGRTYKMQFDATVASGFITNIEVGGNYNLDNITTTNSYTLYFVPSSTNDRISFTANSDFVGSIDNVSVKEYTSADMDVTRATAATRVDENGLVNYAEVLGSEIIDITSGTPVDASNWDNVTSNSVDFIGLGASGVSYYNDVATGLISGKTYSISLTITNFSGSSDLGVSSQGGIPTSLRFASDGSVTEVFTSNGQNIRIFGRTGTNTATFSNFSVKEVTRDNVPRIDYTGGGCPHILAEPQRTNLMPYSEDFSGSSWTKSYVTVTSDSVNSLDGNLNADLILETSAANRHIFWDNTLASGGDYTVSIFLKKQNNRYVFFQSGVDNASTRYGIIYDFDGQVITDINSLGSPTNTSYKVEQHINGWVRLSITQTHTSGDVFLVCGGSDAATPSYNTNQEPNYTGNTSNGFYAWGAQLEESYATSYIPTSGSTVTRNQDIFTRDGIGNLINSPEGSFFIEMAALNQPPFSQISISLSGDNSNDRVLIYTGSGGSEWLAQFRKDSTTIVTVSKNTTITNQSKVAISWKSGKYLMYIDGDKATNYGVGSETTSTTFEVGDLKNLQFSPNHNATSNLFYGKVKQLQVFKTALTDTELATLTQ